MYSTNNSVSSGDPPDQKVCQMLLMPLQVQVWLNGLADKLCKSKSQIVSELVQDFAAKHMDIVVDATRHTKPRSTRFDQVRSAILPRLYQEYVSEGMFFAYPDFKKLMLDDPVCISRERTVKDYYHSLIASGDIVLVPLKDENGHEIQYPPTQIRLYTLSEKLIKSQGKLEGLQ